MATTNLIDWQKETAKSVNEAIQFLDESAFAVIRISDNCYRLIEDDGNDLGLFDKLELIDYAAFVARETGLQK